MLSEKQITRAMSVYPPSERELVRSAAMRALEQPNLKQGEVAELIETLIIAGSRAVGKRLSDRRTDKNRRTLVGARVPRDLADQCKAEAERRGMSVYRWVVWALERGLDE